ncbi:MAG: Rrf2 family transcriptional regulator [Chloroflexi bacterium]|jgi:Rrf2 family protein|nr:Rrf2 family transcriptional regulator [Chloroflexota bacterium]
MLKVSRRLNYGLQLMLALASEVDGGSKSTALIAEKLNIPLPFLHQIAHTLQQNGLIKATPGPRGGLRLGQKGTNITLYDIFNALEGQFSVPTIESDKETTENEIAFELWKEVGSKFSNILKEYKLADLIQNE